MVTEAMENSKIFEENQETETITHNFLPNRADPLQEIFGEIHSLRVHFSLRKGLQVCVYTYIHTQLHMYTYILVHRYTQTHIADTHRRKHTQDRRGIKDTKDTQECRCTNTQKYTDIYTNTKGATSCHSLPFPEGQDTDPLPETQTKKRCQLARLRSIQGGKVQQGLWIHPTIHSIIRAHMHSTR